MTETHEGASAVVNAGRVVRLLWFSKSSAGPDTGNDDFERIGPVVCSDDFQYRSSG